jgi:hypothetical protein
MTTASSGRSASAIAVSYYALGLASYPIKALEKFTAFPSVLLLERLHRWSSSSPSRNSARQKARNDRPRDNITKDHTRTLTMRARADDSTVKSRRNLVEY